MGTLNINNIRREAHLRRTPDGGYETLVPAKELVDNTPFESNPTVQGHGAVFDKNGNLTKVIPYGYSAEGGFFRSEWPSQQDSIYNANAAKQYAPQVFEQFRKNPKKDSLQKGGTVENTPDSEEGLIQLVKDALAGKKDAQDYIETIVQKAKSGDNSAMEMVGAIQKIAENLKSQEMKKGGEIPAKRIISKAKGGCPCLMKKVGGRLIEVSLCDDVKKFQPGGILEIDGYKIIPLKDGSFQVKDPASGKTYFNNGRYSLNGNMGSYDTQTLPLEVRRAAKFADDAYIMNPAEYPEAEEEPMTPEELRRLKGWYTKRYSRDQIKKIQSALNKQAIGEQLDEDGIVGQKTIEAIKRFQKQHKDILTVDGMVGDQTMNALGIAELSDASLPQTRYGQNQAKSQVNDTPVEAQARAYYTSPEMIQYLLNPANATTGGADYFNHYQNALKYVSPEVASRLRYINGDADEYDTEAVENHRQASARETGILEFKNAMANGVIRNQSDIDKWAQDHHLSNEEMQELLEDPDAVQASLTAGEQADWGRHNSREARTDREVKEITENTNRIGTNYVLPAMMSVPALMTGAVPAAMASYLGGAGTNAIVEKASDGRYSTWGQFASDKLGIDDDHSWLMEFTNPGAIAGGLIGGGAGSYRAKVPAKWTRVPNTKHDFGATYTVNNAKVPRFVGTQVSEAVGGNTTIIPGTKYTPVTGVGVSSAPVYEMRSLGPTQRSYPSTVRKLQSRAVPAHFENYTPYYTYQTRTKEPVLPERKLTINGYDPSVTYGPYLGFNRITQ